MNERLRRLLDARANAWNTVQDIRARLERENRNASTDEDTAFRAALDEVDTLSRQIEDEERAQRISGALDRVADEQRDRIRDIPAGEERTREQQYEDAFDAYLRSGMDGVAPEHRQMLTAAFQNMGEGRAQTTATTGGGYLIPPGFEARLVQTMKAYGGIFGESNTIETGSGNPLQWPTEDETAVTGAWLSENSQAATGDITFGTATLSAYTATSKVVLVPIALLQDSAFDLDNHISEVAGTRIGRLVAAGFATGTGTTQPTGLFTAPTTGKTGLVGQTTSVIYNDLVDLQHSVDPAYRQAGNCKWVMADSSLKVIRKLVDGQSRPLWEPSTQAGVPSTLLGSPVVIDQGAPAMAANAKSIGYGDIRRAYITRRVAGGALLRLTERYADYLQVGYLAFQRLDGKPDDAAAFRVYANSAT